MHHSEGFPPQLILNPAPLSDAFAPCLFESRQTWESLLSLHPNRPSPGLLLRSPSLHIGGDEVKVEVKVTLLTWAPRDLGSALHSPAPQGSRWVSSPAQTQGTRGGGTRFPGRGLRWSTGSRNRVTPSRARGPLPRATQSTPCQAERQPGSVRKETDLSSRPSGQRGRLPAGWARGPRPSSPAPAPLTRSVTQPGAARNLTSDVTPLPGGSLLPLSSSLQPGPSVTGWLCCPCLREGPSGCGCCSDGRAIRAGTTDRVSRCGGEAGDWF